MSKNKFNEAWASGFHLDAGYKPNLDCKPVFGVMSGDTDVTLESALAEDPCDAKFYFHAYNKDRTALTKKKYAIRGYGQNSVKLFDDYESAARYYNQRIHESLALVRQAENMLLSCLIPDVTE